MYDELGRSLFIVALSTFFGAPLQINLDETLGKLSHILENDHFAIVVHEQEQCKCTFKIDYDIF